MLNQCFFKANKVFKERLSAKLRIRILSFWREKKIKFLNAQIREEKIFKLLGSRQLLKNNGLEKEGVVFKSLLPSPTPIAWKEVSLANKLLY